MTNTVDLNEKALENEKKDFIKLCKLLETGARIIMILMMIVAPLLALFVGLDAFGIVVDIKSAVAEDWVTIAGVFVVCIGFGIGLNFIASIFRTMRLGETPFRYDVADKIKAAGTVFALTGALCFIMNVAVMILEAAGILNFDSFTSLPDFFSFVFGVFLLALAYVFNYGCKLQQESDETL
ncbi:MAG: hypothetical protein J6A16_01450 [Oscillospiraceae bacterium]|nr:hypothetical protein [Oscillospiraceae bacterium]